MSPSWVQKKSSRKHLEKFFRGHGWRDRLRCTWQWWLCWASAASSMLQALQSHSHLVTISFHLLVQIQFYSSGCDVLHWDVTNSFPYESAAPRVRQETGAIPASSGADQAVVAREADPHGFRRSVKMNMELEDYPGSGANDRHSPWRQERRN
uniref:Uncharacterized protein n=1 Tax=Avena sativa TaxID=4498 RepID=A0ACD5X6C4_AVESA